MAAFCPSERIRFSNAGNRFAVAAADGAPGAASRATGFAELPAAAPPSLAGDALRAAWAALAEEAVSCSRSCCSATSLRNSPSGVNSRRSTTLKVSSCLGSDNGFSLRHFSNDIHGGRILAPPRWRSQVPPPLDSGLFWALTKQTAARPRTGRFTVNVHHERPLQRQPPPRHIVLLQRPLRPMYFGTERARLFSHGVTAQDSENLTSRGHPLMQTNQL